MGVAITKNIKILSLSQVGNSAQERSNYEICGAINRQDTTILVDLMAQDFCLWMSMEEKKGKRQ